LNSVLLELEQRSCHGRFVDKIYMGLLGTSMDEKIIVELRGMLYIHFQTSISLYCVDHL